MNNDTNKLYKLYVSISSSWSISRYTGISGLYSSIEDFASQHPILYSLLKMNSIIKIPFFGYHSPQFTALDPRGLAVTRSPRFNVKKYYGKKS